MDINIWLVVGIVVVIVIISIYNSLVTSYKKVERSRSLVDIYLKKRFDLIPNLVECVKSYSKHEKETLQKVTQLRNNYENNGSVEDANKLNKH